MVDHLPITKLILMKRVLIFFLFPFFIYSQSSISGKITDVDGNVIMGANIIAVNNETNVLDGFGISNENGFYLSLIHI